jgi:predicted DCC family thiol-disulfide oxidoreductase YuxK
VPDPTPQAVILFDGPCHLCQRSVRFVLARDRRGVFSFAPLQSPAARRLLGSVAPDRPETVVLVDGGGVYTRSDAVLRILARLGWPWRLLTIFRIVPRPLRDSAYTLVARRRYRWFGRSATCPLPDPKDAGRFLDS